MTTDANLKTVKCFPRSSQNSSKSLNFHTQAQLHVQINSGFCLQAMVHWFGKIFRFGFYLILIILMYIFIMFYLQRLLIVRICKVQVSIFKVNEL